MIPFPELLYKLTVQDVGSPWARIFRRRLDTASAAANVNSTITTPEDKCVLLTHAALFGTPGAAQNLVSMLIVYGIPLIANAGNIWLKSSQTALAVGATGVIDWQGNVLLPPGTEIRGNVVYNAGVAANGSNLMLTGVQFPMGTIQLP